MRPIRATPPRSAKLCAVCFVFLVPFSGAALVAPGCTPSSQGLCDKACDCEDCDAGEHADCVDAFDDLEEDASDEGCDDDYRAFVDCLDQKMECDDDQISLERCEDEGEELAECLDEPVLGLSSAGRKSDDPDDVPSGGTACERMKACCVASAAEAMVSSASCAGYDSTSQAACEAAIEAYQTAPDIELPAACRF